LTSSSKASGVVSAAECQEAFKELKMNKSLKYILFKLNDKRTEIVVDQKSTDSDYERFLNKFPADGCRWAVYDFHYKLEDGSQRNKLCFFSW